MADNKTSATKSPATEKAERCVNNVIKALDKLQRDGRSLSTAQKTQVGKAIDEAVAATKLVLAGKATAKAGFTLEDPAA